jgi:hypothetical protein
MLLIIDGLNNFIRAYAVGAQIGLSEDISAVVGFLRMLRYAILAYKPDRIVICWDGKGGSQGRRHLFGDYKDQRRPLTERTGGSDENLKQQLSLLKERLTLLGCVQLEYGGMEADDLIALVCRLSSPDETKVIISTDKDFLQLVNERVVVYSPVKRILYDRQKVIDEFGVLPENMVYLRAIVGDKSDNIPGIRGLGVKLVPRLFPVLVKEIIDARRLLVDAAAALEDKIGSAKRYMSVIEGWDIVERNISIMRLDSVPGNVTDEVQAALSKEQKHPSSSSLRSTLLNDGLSVVDVDRLVDILAVYWSQITSW